MSPKAPSCPSRLSLHLGAGVGEAKRDCPLYKLRKQAQRLREALELTLCDSLHHTLLSHPALPLWVPSAQEVIPREQCSCGQVRVSGPVSSLAEFVGVRACVRACLRRMFAFQNIKIKRQQDQGRNQGAGWETAALLPSDPGQGSQPPPPVHNFLKHFFSE